MWPAPGRPYLGHQEERGSIRVSATRVCPARTDIEGFHGGHPLNRRVAPKINLYTTVSREEEVSRVSREHTGPKTTDLGGVEGQAWAGPRHHVATGNPGVPAPHASTRSPISPGVSTTVSWGTVGRRHAPRPYPWRIVTPDKNRACSSVWWPSLGCLTVLVCVSV